jgi:hypothetical protein
MARTREGKGRRRSGIGILEKERGVGRRRENQHVLVIPVEQRRRYWDRDCKANYDSEGSSSGSGSPVGLMSSKTAGKMETEAHEMAKMLSQVFPQNPEMAEIAWEDTQFSHHGERIR